MDEDTAKKLVKRLLERYGEIQFLEEFGASKCCKPAFIRGMWWFTIYIQDANGQANVLQGASIVEVAMLLQQAFEAGKWLEAFPKDSEPIAIKENDGVGAVEEFLLSCNILRDELVP